MFIVKHTSGKTFTLILLLGFTNFIFPIHAQPYVEGGKTRHRFAQLNLGIDNRYFPGAGTHSAFINLSGNIQEFQLEDHSETRLIIGGTHFWGHADFSITIPLISFGKSGFSTGTETSVKYFPWRIENRKLTPFIGMALLPFQYKQGNGPEIIRFKYPAIAGIVFNYKNNLFEAGAGYNYSNTENYYISRTQNTSIKTQQLWFMLGAKIMLETTLSAEKNWLNNKTKLMTDTLASLQRLNSWVFAAGPSSAFFLNQSSYNNAIVPYADQHKASIFPEFGLGYYFHQPDMQINFAYRNVKSEIKAYEYAQKVNRKAFTMEAFKFIADYNGFAVFAGPAFSYERLTLTEKMQDVLVTKKLSKGLKPGITFGWDIRPNRIQSWYLRTNLRYFPNLNIKMKENLEIALDQLEFNFIQLVLFPGRLF